LVSPAAFVREAFGERFADAPAPRLFRAPGRVNLIGEHTDYNLGFVLPIAIHLACYTASAPGNDGTLRMYSKNVDQEVSWRISEIEKLPRAGEWTDYPIGVAKELLKLGYPIPQLRMAFYSEVPVGSGLSSSAAIEVSSALTFLQGKEIDKTELAKLCQRAEREFVGVPVGIMDQYVSVFGEAHKAICIDCRSITHAAVTLPPEVAIIAVNSMVKHDLAQSAYKDRVEQCGHAVQSIRMKKPKVESLRDVTSAELEALKEDMDSIPYRRARHVVTENERVQEFILASEAHDLSAMGQLFVASHRSLQHDYEVSSEELDFLVDTAMTLPGVYGARMTGGGFGGCTVNLVEPGMVDQFSATISKAYRKQYQIDPQIIPCVPDQGAAEIF
jgi:galactokinase